MIGHRLNRLSDQCNRTLTVASVIGKEFGLDLLERLTEEESLTDVLDEAVRARVVEEVPGEVGQYQFAHALIQQTLLEELSTTRRAQLHARVGEAAEDLYGADADVHASELAYHFAEAQALVGTDKVVRHSLIAGERALATYAWEEAQAHFERALGGKEGQAMDAETATILFGLGRVQVATFSIAQAQEAIDILRRAFDAFVDLGDTKNAGCRRDAPSRVFGYFIRHR